MTKKLINCGDLLFYVEINIFISMEIKNNYQRPQLNVICSTCGISFKKDGSEVRRNDKIGRNNYCSLKCSGKNNNKHLTSSVT